MEVVWDRGGHIISSTSTSDNTLLPFKKSRVACVCVLYTTLPVDLSVTWLCPAYYYYDKALPPSSVTTRLRMSKYLSRSEATVAMPSTEAVGAAKPLDISVEKSESSTNPPISCSLKKLSTRCKKKYILILLLLYTTWILFLLVAYSGHTFVVVVVPNITGGMLLHKMFICTAVHLIG